jgi:hypothetical protein
VTTHRTSEAALEIGQPDIVRPIFDTDGHDVRALVIGAVDLDAGEPGLSHFANRYFLRAIGHGAAFWRLIEMPNCAAFLRIVAVGRPMRLAIVSSDCDAAASSISSRCCLYDHVPIFRLPTRAIISRSPSAPAIVGVDRFAQPLDRELDVIRLQKAPCHQANSSAPVAVNLT